MSEINQDELREQITEQALAYLRLCKARDDYSPEMVEPELTDNIMSLLARSNVAIVKEKQDLPENHHNIGGAYYMVRDAYDGAQQDMLTAGFVQVERIK